MTSRLAVPAALLALVVSGAISASLLWPRPDGDAASIGGHASAQLEAPPYVIAVPSVANDGFPPDVQVSTSQVYQGGALLVRLTGATSGTASVFGRDYPLDGDVTELAGIVGFGTEDPPGYTDLVLAFTDDLGTPYTMSRSILVVPTEWTVDYIIIPPTPPDPDTGEPPPPLPNDNEILPGIYAGNTPRKWTARWRAPLDVLNVTGYFGEQRSFNGGPVQGHHGGTDFGADLGTPVYATNDGVVVLSGLYSVRGNLVVVDHGGGVFSAYGHMSARTVSVGEVVAKGQKIGEVGSTGLSTGAHLHWEMSVRGVLVDGLRWLDNTQGF